MLQIVLEIFAVIVAFGGGVLVGAHNVITVDDAIKTVNTAEAQAVAVLTKIGAHKAAA